jgi:hypothetical protein
MPTTTTKLSFAGVIIENTYLFTCHHVRRRSTDPHPVVHQEISNHKMVKFADQQIVLSRQKRQIPQADYRDYIVQQHMLTIHDLVNLNDQR